MLRLRPYKRCDAQYIVKWIKDETAFYKWSADRYDKYPITADDINAQYDPTADSDTFFPMTAFDESGVVGHFIMRFTDDTKEDLRFGFIIVDDSKRGKGYGKEMLKLGLKYAFEILKVKRVTLGVFANNDPAFYCYSSIGFRPIISDGKELTETVSIMGEDWICRELEIHS